MANLSSLGPLQLAVGADCLIARHGWGITPDPSLAITYLSQAAANAADIESQALGAGMKKGGAAKGELVLAIYELVPIPMLPRVGKRSTCRARAG